jgi:hypothetical protein
MVRSKAINHREIWILNKRIFKEVKKRKRIEARKMFLAKS